MANKEITRYNYVRNNNIISYRKWYIPLEVDAVSSFLGLLSTA